MRELDFQEISRDHTGNVTTGSATLVPPNRLRSALFMVNDSDAIIYLGLGRPAVLNRGIRLNASGGSMEINRTNLFKGAINAIHGSTGNKVLAALEIESNYANQ